MKEMLKCPTCNVPIPFSVLSNNFAPPNLKCSKCDTQYYLKGASFIKFFIFAFRILVIIISFLITSSVKDSFLPSWNYWAVMAIVVFPAITIFEVTIGLLIINFGVLTKSGSQ